MGLFLQYHFRFLKIFDIQRIYCFTSILIFDIRESSPTHINSPQIFIKHTCETQWQPCYHIHLAMAAMNHRFLYLSLKQQKVQVLMFEHRHSNIGSGSWNRCCQRICTIIRSRKSVSGWGMVFWIGQLGYLNFILQIQVR